MSHKENLLIRCHAEKSFNSLFKLVHSRMTALNLVSSLLIVLNCSKLIYFCKVRSFLLVLQQSLNESLSFRNGPTGGMSFVNIYQNVRLDP